MSIEGKDNFLTLAQGHLNFKLRLAYIRNRRAILTKICKSAIRYIKQKIYYYDADNMTKMAAMPIFGKKTFKTLFMNQRADFKEKVHVCSIRDSCSS